MKTQILITLFGFFVAKFGFAQSPVLTRQPYLQMPSENAISIKWRTDVACISQVCYGTSLQTLSNCITDSTIVTEHEVRLTSLNPLTPYYYSVGDGQNTLQGDSLNYFRTNPVIGSSKKTRMWIFADSGVNTAEQNQVRDAFLNYNANDTVDAIIMLGDNAYNNGTDVEYQASVFNNHYENIFKHWPVFSAIGNHETPSSDPTTQTGPYFDIFAFPKNAECGGLASGTEAYFSYDFANIHFICLETNTASFRAVSSSMLTWLANDLATTTQKWKVVYFHHPPYTKGGHDSDNETNLIEVRENILPILENYKVDLVLTGHNHQYERSFFLDGHYDFSSTLDSTMIIDAGTGTKPTAYEKRSSRNYKGTVYVAAGTAGVLEGPLPGWPHPAMSQALNLYMGSLILSTDADTLTVQFLDSDVATPTVRDNFSIVKVCDLTTSIATVNDMCITHAPVTLNAFPANGVFSGAGISNNVFDPAIAGAGNHTITYLFTDSFGCSATASTTINVTGQAPLQPATIFASSTVCPPVQGVQLFISNISDAKSYTWSIGAGTTGVSIVSGSSDTLVIVNINSSASNGYTMQVTANNICGASIPQSFFMNRIAPVLLPVLGPVQACPLDIKTYNSLSIHSFSSITWTAPAGAFINGLPSPQTINGNTSVQVEFPAAFNYGKVCVANHPSCVLSSIKSCINISAAPATPNSIYGPAAITTGASGVAYSVTPVAGATGYSWTTPPNATIVSGQNTPAVIVDFGASFSMGGIAVQAVGVCGNSKTLSLFVKSYSPFANGSSKFEYTETENSDYTLSISPNPASQKLFLNANLAFENTAEILLYDLPGNILLKQKVLLKSGNSKQEIDIGFLASGCYLLKISGTNENTVLKFIKE